MSVFRPGRCGLILIALFGLVRGLNADSATPEASIDGIDQWRGTLVVPGMELRLEVALSRSKDGAVSGKLKSLDQANAVLPLSNVTWTKEKVQFDIKRVGGSYAGTWKSAEGQATIEGKWKQGGMTLPLVWSPGKFAKEDLELLDAWVGDLDVRGTVLKLQVRRLQKPDGTSKYLFDSITQNALGIAADVQIDGTSVTLKVPSIMGSFKGTLNESGDSVEGTWKQMGLELPLVLKKQATAAKATPPRRPQNPEKPVSYREVEVQFDNQAAGVRLAGTLTLPEQDAGRSPAVVLVSGSGPQDRDESLMGHKPFLVIADHLTRHGIAVLRYDDRGVGESTGEFSGATTADLATDAAAAVTFLKQRDEIDPSRIGIVGHSEGGLIAPIVATQHAPELAHIVLLAGPGVDGGEILRTQVRAIHASMGADPDEIDEEVGHVEKIITALREGMDDEAFTAFVEEIISDAGLESEDEGAAEARKAMARVQLGQMGSDWFRFFIVHDPVPVLQDVKCPVLALNGDKDLQVLVDVNLPVIEQTLQASGNRASRCVRLEGLNHLFQEAETGSPMEYQSIEQTVAPVVLETLVDWIHDH